MKGLVLIFLCFGYYGGAAQNLVSWVQPLSGTAPSTTASARLHSEAGSEQYANTIPAVGLPFGMTQWTAQTRRTESKCEPPYVYTDSLLNGFRASHWLSGSCTQDYGSLSFMPLAGALPHSPDQYAVPLKHAKEESSPDYYSIQLPGLRVEMTATLRCGFIRVTMLQDDSLYLLIHPNSDRGEARLDMVADKGEIRASNPAHRIYQGWGEPAGFDGCFFVRLNRAFRVRGTYVAGSFTRSDSFSGGSGGLAYIGFYLKKGEELLLRVGTSFVSPDAAGKNLQKEIGRRDFKAIRTAAATRWSRALGKISIYTADHKLERIFYTALYHAMQQPRLFSDVDGRYPVFSKQYQVDSLRGGNYYGDFSMWDIYRAQLPLLEILEPSLVRDLVHSLLLKGRAGGWMPIFPCWNNYTSAMIGDHATAFIASALMKNILPKDTAGLYDLLRLNAFNLPESASYRDGKGRRALHSYIRYGYIPLEDTVPYAFHKWEQVSRTLEYAYDDYALSELARLLGRTSDERVLRRRAFNYRNVFDTSRGLVRGRFADGSWITPFEPDRRTKYITEGTARQYTFYVPQDIPGLAHLMGGPKELEMKLDSLFRLQQYWHGNEPGHQIPFLYDYTSAPWKTQDQVREILATEYDDGPGGLSGNDDAGQMSAWYVFASLGFYPVDPVSGRYLLSAPVFDSAEIQLPGNRRWKIRKHSDGNTRGYIGSLMLNGRSYYKTCIDHNTLILGGRLDLVMRPSPADWGTKEAEQPPALKEN